MSGALVAMAFVANEFSASVSPSSVLGSGPRGEITTDQVVVSVKGGVGPFTYTWARTSGSAGEATPPNAAAVRFVASLSFDAVSGFTCNVTDTATGMVLPVAVDATWVVFN